MVSMSYCVTEVISPQHAFRFKLPLYNWDHEIIRVGKPLDFLCIFFNELPSHIKRWRGLELSMHYCMTSWHRGWGCWAITQLTRACDVT